MLAWAHGTACQYGEAATAAQRAMEHASLGEDERQRQHAASQYAIAALYGPTPVPEGVERCESIVAGALEDRRTQGLVMSLLSSLRAMQGEFTAARDLYTRARLMLEEVGCSVVAASTSQQSCRVELLAGDPAAAERELRRDFDELSEMGERYFLSTAAGELARAVYAQGRYVETEELTRIAEELSADDDVTSQALWRSVRAKALAAAPGRRRAGARARSSRAPGGHGLLDPSGRRARRFRRGPHASGGTRCAWLPERGTRLPRAEGRRRVGRARPRVAAGAGRASSSRNVSLPPRAGTRVTKRRFSSDGRCSTTTIRTSRHAKAWLGGVLLERNPLPDPSPRKTSRRGSTPLGRGSVCPPPRARARLRKREPSSGRLAPSGDLLATGRERRSVGRVLWNMTPPPGKISWCRVPPLAPTSRTNWFCRPTDTPSARLASPIVNGLAADRPGWGVREQTQVGQAVLVRLAQE